MKRKVRLSMCSEGTIFSVPATWERKPRSAISGEASMPERPARSASPTSRAELPMGETIPIPVMATRCGIIPGRAPP